MGQPMNPVVADSAAAMAGGPIPSMMSGEVFTHQGWVDRIFVVKSVTLIAGKVNAFKFAIAMEQQNREIMLEGTEIVIDKLLSDGCTTTAVDGTFDCGSRIAYISANTMFEPIDGMWMMQLLVQAK
jgi:hypothetical protein